MVSERVNTTSTRVAAVRGWFDSGMRSTGLPDGTAPWVGAGLRVLEQNGELTEKVLEEADSSQVMALPSKV